MKKLNDLTRLALLLAAMALSTVSCTKMEDVLKGTSLNLNTDLLKNPLTIQVLPATPGEEIPTDVKITTLGPDRDKVYTVFGEKDLRMNINPQDPSVGFISIGIRKIEQYSTIDPIEFAVKIEAEGYLPTTRYYRIDNEDNQFKTVRLLAKNSRIDGIQTDRNSLKVTQRGLESSTRLRAAAVSTGEQLEVTVAPQTEFLAADGRKLTGSVEAFMAHYDFSKRGVHEMSPVDLYGADALDKAGNHLGESIFTSLATYSLEMETAEGEVKTFSQPLEVTVKLADDAINPVTEMKVEAGDRIPVWSFNEELGLWQEETEAVVVADAGNRLYARFEQAHLSTWFLGGRRFCRPFTEIDILNTNQFRTDPERYYFVEIIRADNDAILTTYQTRFYNGQTISVIIGNTMANTEVYFKVYTNGAGPCSTGDLLYTSPDFLPCGENLTLDLSEPLSNDMLTRIFVTVSGTCSSDYNDLVVSPSVPIFYRETGCDTYAPLGWLIEGEGSTSSLNIGEYYDFRISYLSLDRCIFDLQVPTTDTTVIIDSPVYSFTETVNINYEADGRTIIFDYTDIEVPDQACDEYIEYLESNPFE
ncbi:hypothetical protein [Phaeodactylibacter luteus]|uniref:DUF4493 domain-containing protein n=1 Tax=Phaeodactylibacter luteus TaxID=1564516 RepID=A0A5C6S084_9BACT|nr:hypothetical protein [Phaeodactylibacter luteus]TXB67675.1 hypothetical protein FRY97_04605 [Phaeodactylibacter luteus]